MTNIILYSVLAVGAIGLFMAVVLYFVAQKFKVYEDPRIDDVEKALPGANCGGCGFPGCRGFADACVKAEELDKLFCPVGGNDCMKAIAGILGKVAAEKAPEIAVVRCSGTPEHRQQQNVYDGASKCVISAALYGGETGCYHGCLGLGDCVDVCTFDAIKMDEKTNLPVVIEEKCTACGACVKSCPRAIIELRKKWPKDRKIFVSCVSKDKGPIVSKVCKVGCIGCKKCVKACQYDAITVENFLAYIDPLKCKLCRKCVTECPTGSILEINFPPRKEEKVLEEKKEVITKDDLKTTEKEKVEVKKTEENNKEGEVKE